MQVLGHKHDLKVGKFEGHPINYTYHLILPEDFARSLKEQKVKRVQVNIGDLTLHKPVLHYQDVYYFTLAQKERKLLKVELGDSVEVLLLKDNSTYQIEIAEEMRILLEQDEEANQYFHQLTPGKQRSLLYIVNKVKSSDLRIKKAVTIIDHLKVNSGKLDFKALHQALKGH